MAKNKSFTLIELLVVIFIIILLVTISVIIFNQDEYKWKQNDTKRHKDINELSIAIEAFKADHGHYPFVNWFNGKHAYEAVGGFGINADTICRDDVVNPNYKPSKEGLPLEFIPGTDLGHACDDLSLQLLGRAYLPKMPEPTSPGNDISVEDLGDWIVLDPPKPYLDSIPVDPEIWEDVNPSHADYTSSAHFRYWYNSRYYCPSRAINQGDRYWLNAIVQLKADGSAGANSPGNYYYEVGTMNFENSPGESC